MKELNPEIKSKKFIKAVGALDFEKNGTPLLTSKNVKKVDKYVKKYSSYAANSGDDFVRKYFEEHKGDTSKASIITKIILINTIDSTNLKQQLGKDYYKLMADRIIEAKIEKQIAIGNPIDKKTFKKIASWSVKKKGKKVNMNLFIFLSKYITRTNELSYGRNDYSIMDGVVRDNIHYLRNKDNESYVPAKGELAEYRDNYDYAGYCKKINEILENLPGVTRNMLDHFVWFVFKEEAVNDK